MRVGRLCTGLLGVAAVIGACARVVDEPAAITTAPDGGAVLDARSGNETPDAALPPDAAPLDSTVAKPTITGCEQSLVTMATTTPGATIHYTRDDTTPNASSPRYSEPIVHRGGTLKLKAIAIKEGLRASDVADYACFSDNFFIAAPRLEPDGGTFAGPVSVTMRSATPGATIFYTLDGSAPMPPTWLHYDGGAVTITTSSIVHAIAAFPSFQNSPTTIATFTIGDAGP